MSSPYYILEDSNFDLRYVNLHVCDIPRDKWLSGDPDQMPDSVASDLCLHCSPNTLMGLQTLG